MLNVEYKQTLVKTSYSEEDATLLLKDVTNDMKEMTTEERERAIQSGVHYSEMLPQEKQPSAEYEALYNKALNEKKYEIAHGIAVISGMIVQLAVMEKKPILVSLARAGIPVGVLIKRYIKYTYGIDVSHYAISIIRDKGIDENAMNFIYNKEIKDNKNNPRNIFFIDGWTGKGAILQQLKEAVDELKKQEKWWGLSYSNFFVLADPANITKYCGTHADYLLPSACLNSTVSGLVSRTILNSHINVEKGDFHGAVYFNKFESMDKTNEFIDIISNEFKNLDNINYSFRQIEGESGMTVVNNICANYNIADFKKVKPGIGETTRVLLRRVPWKVLINKNISMRDPDIQHIIILCKEKGVEIERYDLNTYKVCGIIKELSADA